MDRRLAFLIIAGCGSSSEPPKQKELSSPVVKAAGAELTFPDGVDASKVELSTGLIIPRELARFQQAIEQHFTLLRLIQITPPTATWPQPATMTTSVRGCPAGNAIAVALDKAGQPEVLAGKLTDKGLVFSLARNLPVAVLCPKEKLIGTPGQLIRGVPDLVLSDECPAYITPDSPGIKAIAADPKRFAIAADGAIKLDAKLELRTIDEGAEMAKADQVLAAGGGDRVSLGVVYASLLAARNYPVMLVGGAVKSDKLRGVTLWVEAVVDGKPMFVDVDDPARARLVPLADAIVAHGLEVHRGCAWYPPNTPSDATLFDVDHGGSPATPDAAKLIELRKLLDKKCNHGADRPACMERGKLDDQLHKLLDAMLAQHKELESKCKLGKDPAICAERDRLAEQGKAIKAQLDAKP